MIPFAILGALALAQAPVQRPPQPFLPQADEPMQSSFDASAITARPIDELLFDTALDGAVWARGTAYKARFDGAGATIIPYLGSHAPQNYPLALGSPDVALGGASLASSADAVATRDQSKITIDHGSFVEEYWLATESLEQRFVFPQMRGSGDLVLRMPVGTELAATDRGATLRFENELGRIDYGEAFAIDAMGERIALDSLLIDGAIELRVPAQFVAHAAFPLVIDPFVTFFTISGGSRPQLMSDVSYDATSDRWCVSWVDIWSATDYDVHARLVDGTNSMLNTLPIDFSTDVWTDAKIANNNGADLFLVVATVVPPGGVGEIRGRFVLAPSAVTGAPFAISPFDGAYRTRPDVGGDPYPGSPSYFCVVWERNVSSSNADIELQLVGTAGALYGGVVPLENGPVRHELPSIANSCGPDVGDNLNVWTVVWQHPYTPTDHDIYAAQVHWYGAVAHPAFVIEASLEDETLPAVSSTLFPTAFGVARTFLVVYQRDYGDHDLIARVGVAPGTYGEKNLCYDFLGSWLNDQTSPSVDCDGAKFLVAFEERASPGAYDASIWTCNYFLSAASMLMPCELHRSLAGSVAAEFDVAVHSKFASGGPAGRFFGTWTIDTINGTYDVQAGVWDSCIGGYVESFCEGDGLGTLCPCNNNGASGHGCANSVNPSGALLAWSGEASLSADSFVLQASGMPETATCLFFQSANSAQAPFAFGDGLRCAAGVIKRFPLKISSHGAASYPGAGDSAVSVFGQVPGAGITRYYQAWYRDPASFCTSTTYNLTNALRVIWAP